MFLNITSNFILNFIGSELEKATKVAKFYEDPRFSMYKYSHPHDSAYLNLLLKEGF